MDECNFKLPGDLKLLFFRIAVARVPRLVLPTLHCCVLMRSLTHSHCRVLYSFFFFFWYSTSLQHRVLALQYLQYYFSFNGDFREKQLGLEVLMHSAIHILQKVNVLVFGTAHLFSNVSRFDNMWYVCGYAGRRARQVPKTQNATRNLVVCTRSWFFGCIFCFSGVGRSAAMKAFDMLGSDVVALVITYLFATDACRASATSTNFRLGVRHGLSVRRIVKHRHDEDPRSHKWLSFLLRNNVNVLNSIHER